MSDTRIVEKIQKLLALANSANEHEARLAAEKAAKLMVKHNLDMQSVDARPAGYVEEAAFSADYLIHPRVYYVINIINKFFFVQAYTNLVLSGYTSNGRRRYKKKIQLVGTKENVEIAKYVFSFLDQTFSRLWSDLRKRGADAAHQKSFYSGMVIGLSEQLEAGRREVEQEMGLVVIPDAGLVEHMKKKKLRSSGSLQGYTPDEAVARAGYEQGKKLQIRKGLDAPATTTSLALGSGK